MRKYDIVVHRDLSSDHIHSYLPKIQDVIIAMITYFVRIFSYTEGGHIYGASVIVVLFGFYYYNHFLYRVGKGTLDISYKRNYGPINFSKLFSYIYGVSRGILLGNLVYYVSRARLWGESGQILNMFLHMLSVQGILFGATICLLTYLSVTTGFGGHKNYISSAEYRKRIRYKTEILNMRTMDAIREVFHEQDRHLEFGIKYGTPADNTFGTVRATKEKQHTVTETDNMDPYAEVRINRGGNQ